MPSNPPQTLSVKRKRNEFAADILIVDQPDQHDLKRQKSGTFAWRLVEKPGLHRPPANDAVPPPTQLNRRFYVKSALGNFLEGKSEEKAGSNNVGSAGTQATLKTQTPDAPTSVVQDGTPRPRKRPGAGAAVRRPSPANTGKETENAGPTEDEVRRFESLAEEVERSEQNAAKPPASPLRFKPKVPALRFRDRHPEQAAALGIHDPDAMDVDDFVYDTYVREVMMPDANGKIPEPTGTVGIIVLGEDDEDWWNAEEESDKEFDTDEEDENAEDYYANDYPEDELSSDDEYGRNVYQRGYRRGSDAEEYDLDDENEDEDARSDGDEDDEHFRRVARPPPTGYW